jgi:PPOX class probable FMN-dependent enzyme
MADTAHPHRIETLEALRAVIPAPNSVARSKVLDRLDEQALAFVTEAPFLLLATVGTDGRVEVSPKGDDGAVLAVEDERTVLLPERAGNHLCFGLSNILENPQVGVIVLKPATGETLRFSGTAEILADPDLLQRLSARGKPAVLATRIRIERAYFHCARSVLRAGLWKPDTWPAAGKVSFGKVFRDLSLVDEGRAARIDTDVERAYAEQL